MCMLSPCVFTCVSVYLSATDVCGNVCVGMKLMSMSSASPPLNLLRWSLFLSSALGHFPPV